MEKKETRVFYILTKFPKGSGIANNEPVRKLTLSTNDEAFNEEEFEDFEDYVNYCLDEECSADEQHWGTCICYTEEEFKLVQNFKE